MRKWIGGIFVFLGLVCLIGAIALIAYNQWEARRAEVLSDSLVKDAYTAIAEKNAVQNDSVTMPTIELDGEECIGILSIPALDLELPVLTDWSYKKLKKAPCHYYGTYYEKDFVIAAHNFKSHFGRLSELRQGDAIFFTDANGEVHYYEVSLLETLPKNATKDMITSGFDLSLYTCTTGGGSRITVRCSLAK